MKTDKIHKTSSTWIFLFFVIPALSGSLILAFSAETESSVLPIIGVVLLCVSIVFGLWFLMRLPRLLWYAFLRFARLDAIRCAVSSGAMLLLAFLLFATPKVYRFDSGGRSISRTYVVPLWYVPEFPQCLSTFVGLSLSVLLGELVGSVAIGATIWAFAQKNKTGGSDTESHTTKGGGA